MGTCGTIAPAGGVAFRARPPELPPEKGVRRAPVYSACPKGFGIAGMAAASLKFTVVIRRILRAQSFAPIGIWTESVECGLESLAQPHMRHSYPTTGRRPGSSLDCGNDGRGGGGDAAPFCTLAPADEKGLNLKMRNVDSEF